ncbi:hypothetical protein DV20_42405 [Amycolatopsis rifamycinica]|uniref:Uncharacterized protein n=1 Tax=Amycolatopsis rifamycinica TaxID=287986 RepID=A0A066TN19_9PSEU|nr:hypothetical protein DV20_42405 [Amycolatopsis rifamycinica]
MIGGTTRGRRAVRATASQTAAKVRARAGAGLVSWRPGIGGVPYGRQSSGNAKMASAAVMTVPAMTGVRQRDGRRRAKATPRTAVSGAMTASLTIGPPMIQPTVPKTSGRRGSAYSANSTTPHASAARPGSARSARAVFTAPPVS